MSEPKYTSQPCKQCGAPGRVVNPKWLRDRRQQAGLSLREMAARMSFSAPYVSDIELGRRAALPHIVQFYEHL